MKVAELTNKIPKIRVKDAATGRVYDGYYCEFPETTYCCLPHPPIKTVRVIFTYEMTDWGLPNEPRLYKLDDEDEVEFLEDVAEARHGHWESLYWAFDYYRCSECGFEQRLEEFPYCPNCGAKMDESEGDGE